jgi:hypothetical protein
VRRVAAGKDHVGVAALAEDEMGGLHGLRVDVDVYGEAAEVAGRRRGGAGDFEAAPGAGQLNGAFDEADADAVVLVVVGHERAARGGERAIGAGDAFHDGDGGAARAPPPAAAGVQQQDTEFGGARGGRRGEARGEGEFAAGQ